MQLILSMFLAVISGGLISSNPDSTTAHQQSKILIQAHTIPEVVIARVIRARYPDEKMNLDPRISLVSEKPGQWSPATTKAITQILGGSTSLIKDAKKCGKTPDTCKLDNSISVVHISSGAFEDSTASFEASVLRETGVKSFPLQMTGYRIHLKKMKDVWEYVSDEIFYIT